MSAVIRVLDRSHQTVREFRDTPGWDFMGACKGAADRGHIVMATFDPYDDTLVNRTQQPRLMDELTEVLSDPDLTPERRRILESVLAAVRQVYEDGGFLFVQGE